MTDEEDSWNLLKNLRDRLKKKEVPNEHIENEVYNTYKILDLEPMTKEELSKTLDRIEEPLPEEDEELDSDDEYSQPQPEKINLSFNVSKPLNEMNDSHILTPTKATKQWLKDNADSTCVGFTMLFGNNKMPVDTEIYASKKTGDNAVASLEGFPVYIGAGTRVEQGGTSKHDIFLNMMSSSSKEGNSSIRGMEEFSNQKDILESLVKKSIKVKGKKIKQFTVSKERNPGFFNFIENFPSSEVHVNDNDEFDLPEEDAKRYADMALNFSDKKVKVSEFCLVATPANVFDDNENENTNVEKGEQEFSKKNEKMKRHIMMGDDFESSTSSSLGVKNGVKQEKISAWLRAPETKGFKNISSSIPYSLNVTGALEYFPKNA